MKLENQVCSLELSKELKELGVKQESAFYWLPKTLGRSPEYCGIVLYEPSKNEKNSKSFVAAFTCSELGLLLNQSGKKWIYKSSEKCVHFRIKTGWSFELIKFSAETEADMRAKMLIHLIKEGIVKP